MPRATIQALMCGAMKRPLRPSTRPGLIGVEGVDAGLEVGAGAAPAAKASGRAPCRAGGRPGAHTCPRRWPARSRSARPSARCRCRRRRGPRCGSSRPGSSRRQHVAEVVLEDVEAGRLRRQADVHVRAGGLRSRLGARRARCRPARLRPWLLGRALRLPARRGSRTASRAGRAGRCRSGRRGCRAARRRRGPAARSGRGSAPRSARRRGSGSSGSAGRPRSTSG